jgi:hypothetical protein
MHIYISMCIDRSCFACLSRRLSISTMRKKTTEMQTKIRWCSHLIQVCLLGIALVLWALVADRSSTQKNNNDIFDKSILRTSSSSLSFSFSLSLSLSMSSFLHLSHTHTHTYSQLSIDNSCISISLLHVVRMESLKRVSPSFCHQRREELKKEKEEQ